MGVAKKILLLVMFYAAIFAVTNTVAPTRQKNFTPAELYNNDSALREHVQINGLVATINELEKNQMAFPNCHDRAHKAGRYAIEYSKKLEQIFKNDLTKCLSGGYHGAIEAFFKKNGTSKMAENLQKICPNGIAKFIRSQCLHGTGHGVMAWTNYELFDALKTCDLLQDDAPACYSGVFMENIVVGLSDTTHKSKYLNEDPHYPCNVVDNKYKSKCYFLQTSRMLQVLERNFKKVAVECSRAPIEFRNECYDSMGRDVSGIYFRDPTASIKWCSVAPVGEPRIRCLTGVAQGFFWDVAGQDSVIELCRQLKSSVEKSRCNETIKNRAGDLMDLGAKLVFCARLEKHYQTPC